MLAKAQTERENQLEYELLQTKTQLRDIIGSTNIQPLQINIPVSKVGEEELFVVQNENENLKAHNNCMRAQLQELLIQLGRTSSIAGANTIVDKQLQFSNQKSKICQKINELCLRFNKTLDKIELAASDELMNADVAAVYQSQNEGQLSQQLIDQNYLVS